MPQQPQDRARLGFPLATLTLLPPADGSPEGEAERVVTAGGGGQSKSGIKNAIAVVDTPDKEAFRLDFGLDRIVGMALLPRAKGAPIHLLATTAQGKAHVVKYTEDALAIVSTIHTAPTPAPDAEAGPSQRAVAVTRDSKAFISADNKLFVWKISEATLSKAGEVDTQEIHKENIREVELSPDGKLLATIDDHCLGVWDVATCKLLHKAAARGKEEDMRKGAKWRGIAWGQPASGSGKDEKQMIFAVSSTPKEGHISCLRVEEGLPLVKKTRVCLDPITCMAPIRSNQLAFGTAEGQVVLCDAQSLSRKATLKLHHAPITKVAILSTGDTVSVGFDYFCALGKFKAELQRMNRDKMLMVFLLLIMLVAVLLLNREAIGL